MLYISCGSELERERVCEREYVRERGERRVCVCVREREREKERSMCSHEQELDKREDNYITSPNSHYPQRVQMAVASCNKHSSDIRTCTQLVL